MQLFGQILVIAVLALALSAWVMVPAWRRRRRTRDLRAVAQAEGWDFDAGQTAPPPGPLSTSVLFIRGDAHAMSDTMYGHVVHGDRLIPFTTGDFAYWVRAKAGKHEIYATETFSYLLLKLPYDRVPNLMVRPERPQDRFASVMGESDINFESAEFSDRYFVAAADRRFAYDLIHPRMMTFLLETNPPGVDIQDGWMCVTDGRSRWPHAEFPSRVRWVSQFLDLWPRHLASRTTAREESR